MTPAAPAKKPKPVQRVRVRPCGLKLYVLNDTNNTKTTFRCQLEKGHNSQCEEKGVVIMDNGFGLEYQMVWNELGPYEARILRDRIK